MSAIPGSVPSPEAANPSFYSSGSGFNQNVVYGSLIAQANAVGNTITGYYSEIGKQTQELNEVNGAIESLNNLETGCTSPNTEVNTSSVQTEMSAMGITLPNPANASQINDAISSAHDVQTSISSQSATAQAEMQMQISDYNTIIQELSSIIAALTQTAQNTAKNMA